MAITVVPRPVTVGWSDFTPVTSLNADEEAHIDMGYDLQNKNFRRVGNHFMMAETLEIGVRPLARVLKTANQTTDLLAHEQGHYDIGILAARAMARELATLSSSTGAGLVQLIKDSFTLHTRTRLKPIQDKYDADSNHSRNTQEQQRWAGLIQAALGSASATHLDNLPL